MGNVHPNLLTREQVEARQRTLLRKEVREGAADVVETLAYMLRTEQMGNCRQSLEAAQKDLSKALAAAQILDPDDCPVCEFPVTRCQCKAPSDREVGLMAARSIDSERAQEVNRG